MIQYLNTLAINTISDIIVLLLYITSKARDFIRVWLKNIYKYLIGFVTFCNTPLLILMAA